MSTIREKLEEARHRLDEMPAGFGTSPDLAFDDDPIENVVYNNETRSATPVDLVRLVIEGRPVTHEMGPALASILGANPEYLEEVRSARGDDDFGTLLAMIWDTGRLELRSFVPLGVWLGFDSFRRGRESWSRRIWLQLADVYRQAGSSAKSMDAAVQEVLRTLESGALEFWQKADVEGPNERLVEADRFMKALTSDDPIENDVEDIEDEDLLGIPNLAGVLRETAKTLREQGDAAALTCLYGLASTCLATAVASDSNHPFVADSLNRIFLLAVRRARDERTVRFGKHALEIRETVLGPGHPLARQSRVNLGGAHVLLGDLQEAEEMLLQAGGVDLDDAHVQYWLARLYQARGGDGDRRLEAEAWRNYLDLSSSAAGRRWEATRRLRALES